MNKYRVLLSMDANDCVVVKAEGFHLFEQEKELAFLVNSKITAIFNWDSIYGFCEVTE